MSEKQKQNDLLFVAYELETQPHFAFYQIVAAGFFRMTSIRQQDKSRFVKPSLPYLGLDQLPMKRLPSIAIRLATICLKNGSSTTAKIITIFSENLLAEKPEISVNKAIKTIKKTAESVAKSFDDDDFAFSQKVQNAVFHAVEKQENLNPEALADQLFADNLTARLAFKDQVKEEIPDKIRFEQMPMEKI